MSLISDVIRASILRLRDRTFTTPIQILRREDASNGGGGLATTWSVAGTYQGRLRHSRQTDYLRLNAVQEIPTGAWLVMLPTAADVQTTDRIRAANHTFTVIGIDQGRTDALVQTLFCLLAADL